MAEILIRNSSNRIIVDNENFEFLSKFIWKEMKKRSKKEVYSTHFGRIVRPHRLILGVTDPKIIVDHSNGNILDNRKSNLRICTYKENSRNISKRNGKYSSIYKGVTWNKRQNKWLARITTDIKRVTLGYFSNETDAAEAYNKAAIKYHKEFANFTEIKNGQEV